MHADTVATVFALLLAGGLIGLTAGRFIAPQLHAEATAQRLWLAALVAGSATAGSLWFSESAGFTPCEFCWYQRIAMYPLAPLLAIAAYRNDQGIRPYATVLAAAGAGLSTYHYQLQLFPDQGSSCSAEASCTFQWVDAFGFVSIPLLALGSFVLILISLWMTPAPHPVGHSSQDAPEHEEFELHQGSKAHDVTQTHEETDMEVLS